MNERYNENVRAKVIVFSVIFFVLLTGFGIYAYIRAMRVVLYNAVKGELTDLVGNKQVEFDDQVSGVICLMEALAGSPELKRFFLDPDNPSLKEEAYNEFRRYQNILLRCDDDAGLFWIIDKTKEYYADYTLHHIVDPDLPENYWYNLTLSGSVPFRMNVELEPNVNLLNLWIDVPVFDQSPNGERLPIGVVSSGIRISNFVKKLYADVPQDITFYLFDGNLKINASREEELIVNKENIIEFLGKTVGDNLIRGMELTKNSTDIVTFAEGAAVYVMSGMEKYSWHIIAKKNLDYRELLYMPVTAVFIVMMGIVLLVFIVFDLFVCSLIDPLNRYAEILNVIMTNSPSPLLVLDEQNCILHISNRMAEISNLKKTENCLKHSVFELFSNPEATRLLEEAIARDSFYETTGEIVLNERRYYFHFLMDTVMVRKHHYRFIHVTNVTDIMLSSYTDVQTKLPNRRRWNEELQRAWRQAARNKTNLSLLMIDIDDFKQYNDTYGHPQGDEVLAAVGKVLAENMKRPSDLAARIGGEEFAILLPETCRNGAVTVAEKIREDMEKTRIPLLEGGEITSVTISIGVCTTVPSTHETGCERLLSVADKYLYSAKNAGKNRVMSTEI